MHLPIDEPTVQNRNRQEEGRINCEARLGRLLSVVVYDTDGKIVYADSFGEPDRDDILPDTVGDTLQKKVCK